MAVYASRLELPPGYFLARCAVSGGTLEDYLQLLLRQTAGKLCLVLRPEYMDFPLPCAGGVGQALDPDALRSAYQGQDCHFSSALCAEYFTLLRDGQAHAVLFDSQRSLAAKFRLAEAAGVPAVLIDDPALRRLLTGKSTPQECGVL